ncbi:FeoA family protein [Sporomusa sp. KB1]|jgi:ferrous iron transport protein A|uniref:FeoA family protein n=1 Tax=Sporomusa sp. KB1 TaxID=943346 RepID=UPI0011A0A9F6|nr:FeoA family protein [Sporomusa sp. KB1]TWH46169.1 ferrous iron transport protein A [Sporomusa sp. KB1]
MQIQSMDQGQLMIVTALGGSREVRARLTDLGFTPGTPVGILSRSYESIIVKVRGSRIMLNNLLASAIYVEQGRDEGGVYSGKYQSQYCLGR